MIFIPYVVKEMIEQKPEQLSELNKTPLSTACKSLLNGPDERRLYLVQALNKAQEFYQPDQSKSVNRMEQNIWRATQNLLEEMDWRYQPATVYRLLTTSIELEEEMCDDVILEEINRHSEYDDKLYVLLDLVRCNLEGNGYDLDGIEPTRD